MSDDEARALETLLGELREIVETARAMPMSASVLVNRDEALDVVEEALAGLPEELKQARWLLKERQEYLDRSQHEADELLEVARVQAERMVERAEVVREARRRAEQVITDAEAHARRLQHEAEDYVDQRLEALEAVLGEAIQTVRNGRRRLQVDLGPESGEAEDPGEFFDQDERDQAHAE